jgi:hypothetical protein
MLKEQAFAGQSLSGFTECYWSTPETALLEIRKERWEVVIYMPAETSELAQYRVATDHLHILVIKGTGGKA